MKGIIQLADYLKSRPLILVAGAMAVKICYLLYFGLLNRAGGDGIDLIGDEEDYIRPVENLLAEGAYYFDDDNYAGRMPGYAALYLPIRLLFSQKSAMITVLVIQACLSGLSAYILAIIGEKHFGKKLFWPLFLIYALNTYVSYWDARFITESLAVSVLIFSIYFLQKAFARHKAALYLCAGFFMCWLVFLRPYMLILYIPALLLILIQNRQEPLRLLKFAALFLIPFLVSDSLWIVRNYQHEKKIIPLQSTLTKGTATSALDKELFAFYQNLGSDHAYWNPNSIAAWFTSQPNLDRINAERPTDDIIPSKVFDGGLSMMELKSARMHYQNSIDTSLHWDFRSAEAELCLDQMKKFNEHLSSNHFLQSVIGSRLLILQQFLIQPYTYYFPARLSELGVVGKVFKSFHWLFNLAGTLLGVLGMFLYRPARKRLTVDLLLLGIPLFIIMLFPIYLRSTEFRFLVLAYPFLLVYASLFAINFAMRLKQWKVR